MRNSLKSQKKQISYIIGGVFFITTVLVLMFKFDSFYEAFIYRGYLEAEYWVGNVRSSLEAASYYKLIVYMDDRFGIDIISQTNITAIVAIIVFMVYFKVLSSKKGLVSFVIYFNIITIFLFFSPGRTSITLLLVLLFIISFMSKKRTVNLISVLPAFLLYLIHYETLVLVVFFLMYYIIRDHILSFLSIKSSIRVYILESSVIFALSYIYILSFGQDYDVIKDGGNIVHFIFMAFLVFCFGTLYRIQDYLILFVFVLVMYLSDQNAMYVFRVIFLPLCLLITIRLYGNYQNDTIHSSYNSKLVR